MKGLQICPKFEAAFEIIGKRWTGLIIHVLLSGSKRFKEIKDVIPEMSDRMLTERLKELEAAGILSRNVYSEMPVRIEYVLTDKGHALEPIMNEMQKWAETWME
ncbi:winged helix-turn-helix transcriptional regulator [Thermoflavimicrobium daqui]|jgi:DNA-binding HxlR family transcriptional regulator|uniref:Transcriptional regulator n=1 Tax=Thermoflavimicrobium daqui TaxID=2137476 RepID=A0A364K1V5_9BACL|nr:helix-turn-helix domain-containing protein [Thermoflavimicrobium daqui]RAL21913.1 transcriptional regulator [Thermoflavimicrobium daqui]